MMMVNIDIWPGGDFLESRSARLIAIVNHETNESDVATYLVREYLPKNGQLFVIRSTLVEGFVRGKGATVLVGEAIEQLETSPLDTIPADLVADFEDIDVISRMEYQQRTAPKPKRSRKKAKATIDDNTAQG